VCFIWEIFTTVCRTCYLKVLIKAFFLFQTLPYCPNSLEKCISTKKKQFKINPSSIFTQKMLNFTTWTTKVCNFSFSIFKDINSFLIFVIVSRIDSNWWVLDKASSLQNHVTLCSYSEPISHSEIYLISVSWLSFSLSLRFRSSTTSTGVNLGSKSTVEWLLWAEGLKFI